MTALDAGARATATRSGRSLIERIDALGRPVSRRDMLAAVAGAIVLGALTLALPSTPTYDPWSWIGWGREIAHLDLNTLGGPSWKPLPVIFTTVFSLFGPAAPDLWLMIARAGGFLAMLMVFRMSVRLTDRRTALLAGLLAVLTLCTSGSFVRDSALGNSEGLLLAFLLFGIERHVDGHPRQAFTLGFLAALLRPETWPFVFLYGCWLVYRDRRSWTLVLGLFLLLPLLWLGPEYWGSGDFFRAASRAANPNANSPAFQKHPALTVLQNARPVIFTPGKIGVVLALGVALWESRRRRRPTLMLVIALAAATWLLTVAAMTQAGFSGNPRYLIPAVGLLAVLTGVGWGWLAARAGSLAGRVHQPGRAGLAVALGVAVVLGVFAPFTARRLQLMHRTEVALHYQAIVRDRFVATIARLGGRERVLSCGHPFAGAFMVPLVAWYLKTPSIKVGIHPVAPGVILGVRTTRHAHVLPAPDPAFPPVTQLRPWKVSAHCQPGRSLTPHS